MLRSLAFDRRRSALAFGWLGALAIVGVACVTSSDAPSGPSPDVDASTDGGETEASSPPPSDGGDEPGCGNGRILCGTSCVDLATSKEHCGRCDHDCGGGECADSVCQPTMLVEHLPSTAALAVSDEAFFFTREGSVLSCPTAGCADSPKLRCTVQGTADGLLRVEASLVVRARVALSRGMLVSCQSDVESQPSVFFDSNSENVNGLTSNDAGGVFWTTSTLVMPNVAEAWNIYGGTCVGTKCAQSHLVRSSSEPFVTDRLAATTTDVFYRSPSTSTLDVAQDFWRYSIAGGGQLSKMIGTINGDITATVAMRVFGAGLAVASNIGMAKPLEGQLFVCGPSAEGSGCNVFGDSLPELRDFAFDADRLYFAGDDSIWTCPREGCEGSPPLLAKSQAIANDSLQTTSKYVYWLSGKNERAIWRVAKP